MHKIILPRGAVQVQSLQSKLCPSVKCMYGNNKKEFSIDILISHIFLVPTEVDEDFIFYLKYWPKATHSLQTLISTDFCFLRVSYKSYDKEFSYH